MERIVLAAESAMRTQGLRAACSEPRRAHSRRASRTSICRRRLPRGAASRGASLIAAFTLSGATARLLSHYRPPVPIVAFSPNQEVRRRLALLWGVVPRVLEPIQETEAMVRRVEEELLARGLAHEGRPDGDRLRRAGRPAGEDQQPPAAPDRGLNRGAAPGELLPRGASRSCAGQFGTGL